MTFADAASKCRSYAPIGIACALIIWIYCWTAETGAFEITSHDAKDSYYNLLVKGFSSGQLAVKRDAPPGLAALPNPYDPVANAPYVWSIDHFSYELSYYQGKLYLYFGVTPAVVLFWPYAELTGHYCTQKVAVVIFNVLGFLVAAGLIFAVWRRYFPEAKVWNVAAGVFALGLAPCFMDQLSCADMREVPRSCAFAFTMLTFAAIWNTLHHPKHQRIWLALASLAYGLAVGARPSLLAGIIILLIPVVQNARSSPGSTGSVPVSQRIWLLFAAVAPALLVGAGLAAYNDLRFGNPLEFGWRYQLTDIQNRLARPFGLHYLWYNFKFYFLQPFYWNHSFPFIQAHGVLPLPSGYYGTGNPYGGILLNCPFVWLALGVLLIWHGHSQAANPALRDFLWAVLLVAAAGALVLCLFFCGSSSYLCDFLPALFMLAVIGACCLETALRGRGLWRCCFQVGWSLLLGYSIMMGILVGFKTHAYADYIVGNVLLHEAHYPEAITYYKKSIWLDPGTGFFRTGLGSAYVKSMDWEERTPDYKTAFQRDPGNIDVMYYLSLGLSLSGNIDETIGLLQRVIELNPGFLETQPPEVKINLAWTLASDPDPAKRNGQMAILLAESACRQTGYKTPEMVGTLAAAYAEAGRFDDAIRAAKQTCGLAEANGNTNLLLHTRELLALFQNHQPYHQSPANRPGDNHEKH